VAKKTLQYNIRMSEEQRAELEEMCRRRGRPLSFQVEHLIALAKLVIEFCDGNDDLEIVRERLAAAKKDVPKKRQLNRKRGVSRTVSQSKRLEIKSSR
jgi:predicted DNA-binding protein